MVILGVVRPGIGTIRDKKITIKSVKRLKGLLSLLLKLRLSQVPFQLPLNPWSRRWLMVTWRCEWFD